MAHHNEISLIMMYHLIVYGVLHSVASGSDKSKLDSLLKYLMKFKYDVSLNSLTIALFIA